ncbi:hypothetical protein CYY_006708 [Polysphondylium violaceum]|uniref:SCP domain-containing protein n=1 Tax=Polysphondylium violaceum TaxID=133409 RepID=A0A8J4URC4_9MYCE|nr:hypothetical protein CYY_006708 [Polysphondylium violaceum]
MKIISRLFVLLLVLGVCFAQTNPSYHIQLVNNERNKLGLAPYFLSPCLVDAAQSHANYQASINNLTNDSPYGGLFARVNVYGAYGNSIAESVAYGYETDDQMITDVMKNPGLKGNLLSSKYNHFGVATALGSDGRYYWTQLFLVVGQTNPAIHLQLINKERAKVAGLSPLVLSTCLNNAAKTQSNYQAALNQLTTNSSIRGATLFDTIKQYGESGVEVAINVAYYYTTDADVIASLMNSSSKANILSNKFNHLGVATSLSSDKTVYWTQFFVKSGVCTPPKKK